MNKTYKFINNGLGWLLGVVASIVYILTAEPTQSWWDCGEFIATAHKMLVGHPPGAPTFQIIGCVFSLLAGNDPAMVGFWVNVMSALCSGFGIMFLFWTITMFGKKLVAKLGGFTTLRTVAIFAAGLIGALTYTFTDTYWFSAVEGEVYSMSSFFTALVFWCILKWDEEYDNPKPHTNPARWLIFIFYLVGLSIGVHLLNLLTLPAIGLIIYFKLSKGASYKGVLLTFAFLMLAVSILYNVGWMLAIWVFIVVPLIVISVKNGAIRSKAEWGVMGALLASVAVVGVILWGIIPGIVSWAAKFEIFCKNGIGLPFNAGTIIYFMIIFGAIFYAIRYGYKKKKYLVKIVSYSLFFLLIGYSTFLTLVIRSNANPTIDENSPEDAVSLLSYLNRDQYGSTPLIYGQSYNSRLDSRQRYKDGTPVYVRDDKAGKYIITDDRKESIPNYDSRDCMFFPRMWDRDPKKRTTYMAWMKKVYSTGSASDKENMRSLEKGNLPTMEQNKTFMQTYQFGYMYWRYFMWNFVGRQNEIQGYGDYTNGNWISGIPLIDNKLVGKSDELPRSMQQKGHNTYYFLPLLLGLIGLIYYSRRDLQNSFVVFMLFLMTGWAIAFYLNNAAFQPRERDYAYAASFYAFSIWVGFGVFALIALLEEWKSKKGKIAAAVLITLICLGLVPGIMAKENWDDHDRSNRYTALAFAKNYLDSCEPNAIFFTMGDNETFPLWYAQEVEGYRTDVRVCNLSLLNGSWYVDQMKQKAYNSDPLSISLTKEQYRDGNRDVVVFSTGANQFVNIKNVMEEIRNVKYDGKKTLVFLTDSYRYAIPGAGFGPPIPASFSIPVDKEKVLANGTVRPEDADLIVNRIMVNRNTKDEMHQITRSELIMMDILANFDWDRPLYFSISSGPEAYFGLEEYFQLDGMAYRLVPIKSKAGRGHYEIGRVNTTTLPNKLLNIFPNHARVDVTNNPERTQKQVAPYLWGGLNDKRVYFPDETARMFNTIKTIYLRAANQLVAEGNIEKAEQIHDKLIEIFDPNVYPYVSVGNLPYTYVNTQQTDALLKLGTTTATEKALSLIGRMLDELNETFIWYEKCDERTITIHNENIDYLLECFRRIDAQLSEEQRVIFQDKYEQLRLTKTLTIMASRLGSEIDLYLKKGTGAQREMIDNFARLSRLGDIATLTSDSILEEQIVNILDAKINKVSDVDPQMGRGLRNYYLSEN